MHGLSLNGLHSRRGSALQEAAHAQRDFAG